MDEVLYRWRIRHPELGEVEVIGKDKLQAVAAAGCAWKTPWTRIARACEFEKMGVYGNDAE